MENFQLKTYLFFLITIKNQLKVLCKTFNYMNESQLTSHLQHLHMFLQTVELDSELQRITNVLEEISTSIIGQLSSASRSRLYYLLRQLIKTLAAYIQARTHDSSRQFEITRLRALEKKSKEYENKMRQRLSNNLEGFGSRVNGYKNEYRDVYRQARVAKMFFNPHSNAHNDVKRLSNEMVGNRTSDRDYKTPILITNIPSRRVITAAVSALEQIWELNQTQWKLNGFTTVDRKNKDFCDFRTREKAQLGNTIISWQNHPALTNRGNLLVHGVGEYGAHKTTHILNVINRIVKYIEAKESIETIPAEQRLAEYMLRYFSTGQAISLHDLGLRDIQKNQKEIERINKILFLIGDAEIWRYLNPEMDDKTYTTADLPVAHALYRGLKLVQDGHLTMADLFDNNADYGVPTAKGMTLPHTIEEAITKKAANINQEYIENFQHDDLIQHFLDRFSDGYVASFREAYHQELREHAGGEDDTDNEYISSDEETLDYDRDNTTDYGLFSLFYGDIVFPTIDQKWLDGILTVWNIGHENSSQQLQEVATMRGFTLHNVSGDGNCFFHAVAHQLTQHEIAADEYTAESLREIAIRHIIENMSNFQDFLMMPFDEFIERMRKNNEWVDHLIITALSEALQIKIIIIRSDGAEPHIIGEEHDNARTVYLGYQVGLHYQSLSKIG